MAFQEKSAWLMSVALLLGGAFYFGTVSSLSAESGTLAQPMIPTLVIYAVILVALAIVGHVAIAMLAPKDATTSLDERERRIAERAGFWSGHVVGFGVICSLGAYLFYRDGDLLFYSIFLCLMFGQLAEYAVQIFLYRNAVG